MHNRQSTIDNDPSQRPRLVVVSPFLDKRHGTERCVAEQVERLAQDYDILLYSNAVRDVDLGKITWRRVPALPRPHLFAYAWWVLANHFCRWRDARNGGAAPALVYSPGINCFDADVISVHVVFAEFYGRARHALEFGGHPVLTWPRLAHRHLYYRLLMRLERLVYTRKKTVLTTVSARAARSLQRYGREESEITVIHHGLDPERFNPEARARLREEARGTLGIKEDEFCLLLVGNDWKNKGLPTALECMDRLWEPRIRLLVAGQDTAEPYRQTIERLHLEKQVTFLPPRPDVEFYYAAADLYVGPSLEDAFGLPPLEAMACGVPAITSAQAGVSEVITEGKDGFVLDHGEDSERMSEIITLLFENESLRRRIGENAAKTAKQYSWDHNAEQLRTLLSKVLQQKELQAGIEKEVGIRDTAYGVPGKIRE
jgi:UDP-glucose:(heptosyl)LPS alpha-1,3-glucosyltransferase